MRVVLCVFQSEKIRSENPQQGTVACTYNEAHVNTTRQETVLNWAENVREWADCLPISLALCGLASVVFPYYPPVPICMYGLR